jgi:hypothetical protein
MELTELTTMEQVEAAVRDALVMPMNPAKARRKRAARLADLLDMQAQLYREAIGAQVDVPTIYRAACELAASRLTERSAFFRREAGSR